MKLDIKSVDTTNLDETTFFDPPFYLLKVILIVIELIQANKKSSKKGVLSILKKNTDEIRNWIKRIGCDVTENLSSNAGA